LPTAFVTVPWRHASRKAAQIRNLGRMKEIADIENVETVFKNGVGYDSTKLIESVRGQVGIR
jgi:hypothetical protein